MCEEEKLSRLMGDIYDTALDSALWPGVLIHVARFVGGQAAGLLAKDSVGLERFGLARNQEL